MSDFSIGAAAEAAREVARHLGLGEVDSAPWRVSEHVTLRLPSADAVARIKPVAAEAAMRLEIDVVAHLAAKGAPVVPLLSGPHVERGFAMSFWHWVPHRPADPENESHRRIALVTLRQVHEALADYPGAMPSLWDKVEQCRRLLREAPMPGLEDADRRFLLEIAARFAKLDGEAVPLHGDAGFHNLFITGDGGLWTDFEAACRGPLGWDAAALGLGVDPFLSRLRSFCVAVWCWNFGNNPEKREAAEYHLDHLRR